MTCLEFLTLLTHKPDTWTHAEMSAAISHHSVCEFCQRIVTRKREELDRTLSVEERVRIIGKARRKIEEFGEATQRDPEL